jgi:hypothetical protein
VPVETLVLTLPNGLRRGDWNAVDVRFNGAAIGGATDMRWQVTQITVGTTNIAVNNLDVEGERFTVPQGTRGGTLVTVRFRSLDRVGNTFMQIFTVEQQNTSLYNLHWGFDNNLSASLHTNRNINPVAPQLHVNHSTTISLDWNGLDLSTRGVTWSVAVVSGIASVSGTTLTMGDNAGGHEVRFRVSIFDDVNSSAASNTFEEKITAFRPMSGGVWIPNGSNITEQRTPLQLSGNGWDSTANFGIENLRFVAEQGATSITPDGIFTVNSASAPQHQTLSLSFDQTYNNALIAYQTTASVTLRRMILWHDGGSSNINCVFGVNGFEPWSVEVPTRTGYTFTGYWGYDHNWNLVQVYDHNGNRIRNFSTLVIGYYWLDAYWTANHYTVQINARHNGGKHIQNNILSMSAWYDRTGWFEVWGDCIITGVSSPSGGSVWFHFGQNTRHAAFYFLNITSGTGRVEINVTATCSCGNSGTCVAEGTLITLADGTEKAVEDLDGTEELLVWNFHTGTYDSANIVFIESGEREEQEIIHLFFSDGTELELIGHHGYWNFSLNQYVTFYNWNATDYIGHWFKQQSTNLQGWNSVQLVDAQVYTKYTSAWSPVTVYHLNFYTNGMLSMPGATAPFMNIFEIDADTMSYNHAQRLADIDEFGLFTYEDLAHLVPELVFDALALQYLSVAVGKGQMTWEDMERLAERFYEYFLALLPPGGAA